MLTTKGDTKVRPWVENFCKRLWISQVPTKKLKQEIAAFSCIRGRYYDYRHVLNSYFFTFWPSEHPCIGLTGLAKPLKGCGKGYWKNQSTNQSTYIPEKEHWAEPLIAPRHWSMMKEPRQVPKHFDRWRKPRAVCLKEPWEAKSHRAVCWINWELISK